MFIRKRPPGDQERRVPKVDGPTVVVPPSGVVATPSRPDIPTYTTAPPRRASQDLSDPVELRDGIIEPTDNKLIVGRAIHLKGEITSCEELVVEGRVEAAMDSRSLFIMDGGVFAGECQVDTAVVIGTFHGTLVVRDHLRIRPGGRVSGDISYASVEIEPGGVLSGRVSLIDEPAAASVALRDANAADQGGQAAIPDPGDLAARVAALAK